MRGGTGRIIAVAAAVLAALAWDAGAASASAFHPTHRYDCYAPQAITGGLVYVVSYQFRTRHRYSEGFRSTTSRTGLSRTFSSGRYKLAGGKIVGLSGQLKKDRERLLIQKADLAPLKPDGSFTGIGCYDSAKGTSQGGGGSGGSGSGGFRVGSLVIRSTREGENNPPATEHGGAVPTSYDYCKEQ
jgi:hypothetical protein